MQNSLFITNTNEPISILFHQHGKNRKFVLCVFFDYIQTRFRVGSQGEYLDKYVFEMNDNEQIEFPLFLSPDIVPDNKTHKLLLSFIAGPDEYAADKNDVTSEYGHVSLFDLSFSPEAYSRTTEIVEPIYPLSEQDNDLPFDHLDVVINTDYANDAAHYQWIKEPDKEYAVKTNEALALMYNISDSLRYSEAILLITIGYRQEPIFNQKYAVFHLKPDCVANGKFFVTTPSVPGKYEFIAYDYTIIDDGLEAAKRLSEDHSFDLALLDVMLPGLDGFALMEHMQKYNIPVIYLTAKADVPSRIKGLKIGAEDYIVKPFSVLELLVRIEKVLDRAGKLNKVLRCRDITIDTEKRTVTKSGEAVALQPLEFDLLVKLIKFKNCTMTRERLLSEIWGVDFVGGTRTVDTHVASLRKKLGLEGVIVTVTRIGYRLED